MRRVPKRNTTYASTLLLILSSLAGQPAAMSLVPTQAVEPSTPASIRHRDFEGTVDAREGGPLTRSTMTRAAPALNVVIEGAEPEPLATTDDLSFTQVLQDSPHGGRGAAIVDQAYLVYSGLPSTIAAIGRQQLRPDGSRFDSTEGRHERGLAFDTITIVNTALPGTTINYAYLFNGHGISGFLSPSSPGATSSHVVGVVNESLPALAVNLYGTLFDIGEPARASAATYGVRLSGDTALGPTGAWRLLYTADHAYQDNHGNNPKSFGHRRFLVEPGLRSGRVTARIGYEVLDGDGDGAFQMPADTMRALSANDGAGFFGTPDNGTRDIYLRLDATGAPEGRLDGVSLRFDYHQLAEVHDGADAGSAWRLDLSRMQSSAASERRLGLTYQGFVAGDGGDDSHKLLLSLRYRF